VAVQRMRIELGENMNLIDATIETITDRNINDPELASERHSRFGAIFRQGIEPCSFTTTENYR